MKAALHVTTIPMADAYRPMLLKCAYTWLSTSLHKHQKSLILHHNTMIQQFLDMERSPTVERHMFVTHTAEKSGMPESLSRTASWTLETVMAETTVTLDVTRPPDV